MNIILVWMPAIAGVVSIVILLISSIKKQGKYEEKIEQNQKNIKEIREDIKEIRGDVKKMETLVTIMGMSSKFFNDNNPITLTDDGIKLSQSVEAERILRTCIERLQNNVAERNPQNPYEVQEYSKEVVYTHFLQYISEADKNKLQTAVYE